MRVALSVGREQIAPIAFLVLQAFCVVFLPLVLEFLIIILWSRGVRLILVCWSFQSHPDTTKRKRDETR